MKNFLSLLAGIFFVSSSLYAAEIYKVDPATSEIQFVSVKNETVKVPGVFKKFDGQVSLDNRDISGRVTVDINSLDTKDNTRNTNLKTTFFETPVKADYRKAVFILERATLSQPLSETNQTVTVHGHLTLHGQTKPLETDLVVSQKDGKVNVRTVRPIILAFADWDFTRLVPRLMSLCGHKSLDSTASVSLNLFLKNKN